MQAVISLMWRAGNLVVWPLPVGMWATRHARTNSGVLEYGSARAWPPSNVAAASASAILII